MAYIIRLPTSEDRVQVLGTYHAMMLSFAEELLGFYEKNLTPILGPDWFRELKSLRAPAYNALSKDDPAFLINEAWRNAESPIRQFMPVASPGFLERLGKIRHVRNDWAHYALAPNLFNLERAARIVESISKELNLACAQNFANIRERCKQILDGDFVPANNEIDDASRTIFESEQAITDEARAAEEIIVENIRKDLAELERVERPAIGSQWVGELGPRKLRILKSTRELWDLENPKMVNFELGENAKEIIDAWLLAVGSDCELHVAADGAVAGPVQGKMCLIGYFGELPKADPNQIRGFLTNDIYVVRNGEVVAIDSDRVLRFQQNEGLNLRDFEGAEVRVTTLGDVGVRNELLDGWLKLGKTDYP